MFVGIDPRYDKYSVPLIDQPLHQRVFRLQVEDIEFIDPCWHHQQRRFEYFLRCRLILDELYQVVLVNDLAFGERKVAAYFKGAFVGHADAQLALTTLHILEHVFKPVHKIFTVAVDGGFQHFRIGDEEIGGRKRIDELARIEINFARGVRVHAGDILDRMLQPARGQQIGLFHEIEYGVLFPRLVLEAPVLTVRHDHRLLFVAQQAVSGILPQMHVILPKFDLLFPQLDGVAHQARAQLHERTAHIHRVERGLGNVMRFAGEEFFHDLLAFFSGNSHVLGKFGGVMLTLRRAFTLAFLGTGTWFGSLSGSLIFITLGGHKKMSLEELDNCTTSWAKIYLYS